MKRHIRILAAILCVASSCMMEGCIGICTGRATIIDTGGAIANIGQEQAKLRPEAQTSAEGGTEYRMHYRTWKKGDTYFLQLPVCYVPSSYPVLVHFAGKYTWKKKTLDGQYPQSYRYHDAELAEYPVEYFYAELTEKQYESVLRRIDKRMKQSTNEFRGVCICPAAEMDLSHAEPLPDYYGRSREMLRVWRGSGNIPPSRRTWYNQCLRPVSWLAEVVDIPLSLIATPVGWVVDVIYESVNN